MDFVKENFDYPYYLLRDRLSGSEGHSARDVKRGEGKVLKLDGQRVACSRDKHGKLTALSTICSIWLHCALERRRRNLDCPCHGSRFQATGKFLPARPRLRSRRPRHRQVGCRSKQKTPRPRSAFLSPGSEQEFKRSILL